MRNRPHSFKGTADSAPRWHEGSVEAKRGLAARAHRITTAEPGLLIEFEYVYCDGAVN